MKYIFGFYKSRFKFYDEWSIMLRKYKGVFI